MEVGICVVVIVVDFQDKLCISKLRPEGLGVFVAEWLLWLTVYWYFNIF